MVQKSVSELNSRYDQMFPVLSSHDVGRIAPFGTLRHFAADELIVETGRVAPGMILVLKGQVAMSQRDGLGHVNPIVDHGPGQFIGEVGQLSGRASLVDARADGGEVEALVIPPDRLRALMVAEADLGERIMRALILRRVGLIQSGVGGPLIVGDDTMPDVARLQNFLNRNGYPHHLVDPATDEDAASFVAASPTCLRNLPWVVLADGTTLRNPGEPELARAIGMNALRAETAVYDVAIVGAGPAGLATAVYAASEGLSVAVLDSRAYGGQAGASARIENYLGFPTGISGGALTGRAFVQAQKFGADMMIPTEVLSLDCSLDDGLFGILLDAGERIRARSVVIASGARYRRPPIAELDRFEGKGVWYWASPVEAKPAAGQEVIVVGGGNSAGQAAVYLSGLASKVDVLIRGPRARRQHVALPDRPPGGDVQYRTAPAHRTRGARRVRSPPRAGMDARQCKRTRDRARHAPRLSVRRRRPGHRLARRLRRRRRQGRFRRHRRSAPAPIWRPACRAFSPSATCARARSSASAAPSARARRWSPPCTAISPPGPSRRPEGGRSHGRRVPPRRTGPGRDAERARLRGMPEDRQSRGCICGSAAPAAMSVAATTRRTATPPGTFTPTRHPVIEGYDPPEGWGWCYVDEIFLDLSDRKTPQLGPIPRFT